MVPGSHTLLEPLLSQDISGNPDGHDEESLEINCDHPSISSISHPITHSPNLGLFQPTTGLKGLLCLLPYALAFSSTWNTWTITHGDQTVLGFMISTLENLWSCNSLIKTMIPNMGRKRLEFTNLGTSPLGYRRIFCHSVWSPTCHAARQHPMRMLCLGCTENNPIVPGVT